MKKIILSAIIIIASIKVAKAQDIKFGVKGGANFSDVSFSVEQRQVGANISLDTDKKTSFVIGGFIEYHLSNLSDKLYGEIRLNYSANGATIKPPRAGESSLDLIINQLNLPIMVKYELIENLYASAGGYLGYVTLMEGKENTRNSSSYKIDEKEISRIDAGLVIGTEYSFNNGLLVFANYNYGFLDLKEDPADRAVETTIKNRVFQLGIGYKF